VGWLFLPSITEGVLASSFGVSKRINMADNGIWKCYGIKIRFTCGLGVG
jgi:hypothetical protein